MFFNDCICHFVSEYVKKVLLLATTCKWKFLVVTESMKKVQEGCRDECCVGVALDHYIYSIEKIKSF